MRKKKKQRGISAEEAERLDRLWREEGLHGPAVTSKTSIHHHRTTKFSMSKEPTK